MKVQVVKNTSNELPKYETALSAGMDLRAELKLIDPKFLFNARLVQKMDSNYPNYLIIEPGGRALIPTGLHISLPIGYEARIQPRSGLALKKGVTCLNSPGCIDADYRGDIGVILINHGFDEFIVEQGDRIAQMIVSKVETVEWEQVKDLDITERGEGGFGSTKIK